MTKKVEGATEDFLDGLGEEVVDPFAPNDNDDLFPEDTETVVEEDKTEVEAKAVPFHKDEKVQKYLDRQLRKQREELIKELKPSATDTFRKEVSVGDPDLVKAFEGIIGNDTPEKQEALKALEKSLSRTGAKPTKEEIQELLRDAQKEQAEREAQEVKEAEDELNEGFEEIEDHYSIELTDRQKEEYKKFLLKVEPRGGYIQYPDFVETFEVFKNYVKANRPSNTQAKMLASRGMERSSSVASTTSTAPKREGTKSLWQTLGH